MPFIKQDVEYDLVTKCIKMCSLKAITASVPNRSSSHITSPILHLLRQYADFEWNTE